MQQEKWWSALEERRINIDDECAGDRKVTCDENQSLCWDSSDRDDACRCKQIENPACPAYACANGETRDAYSCSCTRDPCEGAGSFHHLIWNLEDEKAAIEQLAMCTRNINEQDRNLQGNTPLMSAIVKGMDDLALALIGAGADLNVDNYHGNRALYLSVKFDRFDVAKSLIENGALVNDTNQWGNTALMHAADHCRI